jgi:hypothetical protein
MIDVGIVRVLMVAMLISIAVLPTSCGPSWNGEIVSVRQLVYSLGDGASENRYEALIGADEQGAVRLVVLRYERPGEMGGAPTVDYQVKNGVWYIEKVAKPLDPGLNVYYCSKEGLERLNISQEGQRALLDELEVVSNLHGKGLDTLISEIIREFRGS